MSEVSQATYKEIWERLLAATQAPADSKLLETRARLTAVEDALLRLLETLIDE